MHSILTLLFVASSSTPPVPPALDPLRIVLSRPQAERALRSLGAGLPGALVHLFDRLESTVGGVPGRPGVYVLTDERPQPNPTWFVEAMRPVDFDGAHLHAVLRGRALDRLALPKNSVLAIASSYHDGIAARLVSSPEGRAIARAWIEARRAQLRADYRGVVPWERDIAGITVEEDRASLRVRFPGPYGGLWGAHLYADWLLPLHVRLRNEVHVDWVSRLLARLAADAIAEFRRPRSDGEACRFQAPAVLPAEPCVRGDRNSFRFELRSGGHNESAWFRWIATGDLDCDGVMARFEITGRGTLGVDGRCVGEVGPLESLNPTE